VPKWLSYNDEKSPVSVRLYAEFVKANTSDI